jgi:hypothetical protein
MSWEKLKPGQQYGETITLRQPGIALAGTFVRGRKLESYEYVELFVDDSLRRIGFKFHTEPTGATCKLIRESKSGRFIQTTSWRTKPWLDEIVSREKVERRFLIETDETVEDPTAGVRYFAFVGYSYLPKREFDKQGDYPRLPGVYRLFNCEELVRIGESNDLETRLKDHLRSYKDQVDSYDFTEIDDAGPRKAEESRLLQEFREAYGRLPKLNKITA